MELTYRELQDLLTDAAEAGARKALIESGHISATISKRDAYRSYGKALVDRWIAEGLIIAYKDGTNTSKMRIDREQIKILSTSSNRVSWFKNHS